MVFDEILMLNPDSVGVKYVEGNRADFKLKDFKKFLIEIIYVA